MKPKVLIVDYGVGNLLSVSRAFEFCGGEVKISGNPTHLTQAERLILPGVGTFGNCMQEIRKRNLLEPLLEYARTDRPFLGICVGMQILHETGEEFGEHQGLGLIAGTVSPIPDKGIDGTPHKVPHIGWSGLLPSDTEGTWDNTVLSSVTPGENVYFVHSFGARPTNPQNMLAHYHYDGQPICAAVRSGNIYGCQFHPEKSGRVGLKVVKSFLEI